MINRILADVGMKLLPTDDWPGNRSRRPGHRPAAGRSAASRDPDRRPKATGHRWWSTRGWPCRRCAPRPHSRPRHRTRRTSTADRQGRRRAGSRSSTCSSARPSPAARPTAAAARRELGQRLPDPPAPTPTYSAAATRAPRSRSSSTRRPAAICPAASWPGTAGVRWSPCWTRASAPIRGLTWRPTPGGGYDTDPGHDGDGFIEIDLGIQKAIRIAWRGMRNRPATSHAR